MMYRLRGGIDSAQLFQKIETDDKHQARRRIECSVEESCWTFASGYSYSRPTLWRLILCPRLERRAAQGG